MKCLMCAREYSDHVENCEDCKISLKGENVGGVYYNGYFMQFSRAAHGIIQGAILYPTFLRIAQEYLKYAEAYCEHAAAMRTELYNSAQNLVMEDVELPLDMLVNSVEHDRDAVINGIAGLADFLKEMMKTAEEGNAALAQGAAADYDAEQLETAIREADRMLEEAAAKAK